MYDDDESAVSIYLDGKKKTHRAEEQRERMMHLYTHKKDRGSRDTQQELDGDLVKNCRESLFKRPGPTREEKRRRCTTVFYRLLPFVCNMCV